MVDCMIKLFEVAWTMFISRGFQIQHKQAEQVTQNKHHRNVYKSLALKASMIFSSLKNLWAFM